MVNKFFPESKGYVSKETGLDFGNFILAMKLGNFNCDYSCEVYGIPPGPDLGLAHKGGFDGEYGTVYLRLLEHANFHPEGRCIIVPDVLGFNYGSHTLEKPFICDQKMVGVRLEELDNFFDESCDILIVFESGEALAIDHDHRFFWSKSKINNAKR